MNAEDAANIIRSECTDCSVDIFEEVDVVRADKGIEFSRDDGSAH